MTATNQRARPTLLLTRNPGIEAMVLQAAGPSREVVRLSAAEQAFTPALNAPWDALIVDLGPDTIDHALPVIRLARARRASGVVLGLSSIQRDCESALCSAFGVRTVAG
jgi:hypothetical protein